MPPVLSLRTPGSLEDPDNCLDVSHKAGHASWRPLSLLGGGTPGDLVADAGDSPAWRGAPQVLLDRTVPLAVLVEASLVPSGDAPEPPAGLAAFAPKVHKIERGRRDRRAETSGGQGETGAVN